MVTSVPLVKIPLISDNREQILAAIDMGTNSLHLVVVKIDPTLPAFTIIDRDKETVRLGDCEANGNLKVEVMDRAIATLDRFQKIAKSANAEQIIAVATSAVREAPNGTTFLNKIADELDLYVNLISGQEEARRIYLGVLSAMEFNNKPHVIIDIGGGSTELILGDGNAPRTLSSTKVGAVRLTKEFVTTDPINKIEFAYLRAYVRGLLERPTEELLANIQEGEKPQLVGTSGTIEALANIHAYEKFGNAPTSLAGYQFSLAELQGLVNKLKKLSVSERQELPGMSQKRSEIILAGALVLQEAMSLLGMESITVCERSLREGVIVDWMLNHSLIYDRLRFQSSIRQRNTLKIAQKYQVNLEYSERVASWGLHLFDQTQGVLHEWGSDERELLWAAGILHNCGIYVSHSSHHKHSYYLIRNGELLGYSEIEIEAIANMARYHRKSLPKKKHENYQNLPKKYQQMVSQLSALLRLAIALDRRQKGAIADVKCELNQDKQEFYMWLRPANPEDDCALELWNLDYKKEAFEEEFALKLIAKLEPVMASV
ncbi:MAG: Ppx/GppA family phosphatase [Okeania sp. SIO2G4]|uniref:Ppx/GppA phosphatase family protein n=1 Tax=unclassified Okeania TaxID=2634635 RepID=UPI0013B6D34C|nr:MULTISPECIES: Ppx/GppA phosphatase family protein [unclassified Okeania]NEP75401.1 Ppx/GppA family phosphatase [Okeania sp. SIO2G5]NEP96510.1 Ppx/GppA family phosphatase [Okeania sp. SIO2F5]NEQ92650.1 Ppx/GppA family phosphatase [Okeania sp. SIO2G4]